jgi:hypothetical protein
VTLAAAAVAVVASGSSPVSAQSAPAPYSCVASEGLFPAGTIFPTQVSGSASAPASADIGTEAALSDVAVTVAFDPNQLAFILEVTGSASLGPNGSANLGGSSIGEDGTAAFSGGSGSVTATGQPGDAMAITLDSMVITLPAPGEGPFLVANCTPTGGAVTLASVELTGEAPSTTTSTTAPSTPSTTERPGATTTTTRPGSSPTTQPATPTTTLPTAPPAAANPGSGQPKTTG